MKRYPHLDHDAPCAGLNLRPERDVIGAHARRKRAAARRGMVVAFWVLAIGALVWLACLGGCAGGAP